MFDGQTYERDLDYKRLSSQLERVKALMSDGNWRDLESIKNSCGGTVASVSARLRDLRKEKFGGFVVNRKRIIDGYFEYQLKLTSRKI